MKDLTTFGVQIQEAYHLATQQGDPFTERATSNPDESNLKR